MCLNGNLVSFGEALIQVPAPAHQQADQRLAVCLEAHRQLYNAALEERREAYRRKGLTLRYGQQSVQLKDIRRADPVGYGCWSFSSQQATLRRLDRAMQAFFRRVSAGQRPGYPRFKSRGGFDTIGWPRDGDGCRWDSSPESGQTRVYLQGVGHIRVHAHRKVTGEVKTISVKREGQRWFVVLSCDGVAPEPLPRTGLAVGIDLGVVSFLTTSDGESVPNPRPLHGAVTRIAAAQRVLAGRRRGSKRRRKTGERIATLHAKVRRQRRDHAHKAALWLVSRYDLIAHEQLNIAGMTRRPKPHVASENRVKQAVFTCVRCNYAGHADVVGARNVLHRAGLALQAAPAS